MTSTKSRGVHLPSALDYLIQESLLPPNPARHLYQWDTYCDDSSVLGEEEVVTTERCVVWSQAGVVQRVFRLESEQQDITQALLVWFEVDNSLSRGSKASDVDGFNSTAEKHGLVPTTPAALFPGIARCRALVVILRHQAHVYFLQGSSHVVNLPIEVECAFPAPKGLILQRKVPDVETDEPYSPTPPTPPPNSFNVSQHTAWTSPASRDDTDAHEMHSFPSRNSSPTRLDDLIVQPRPAANVAGPHLFTMTDPLRELGLVVEAHQDSEHPMTLIPISRKEEILHISAKNVNSPPGEAGVPRQVVTLTINRERQCYSVWSGFYFDHVLLKGSQVDYLDRDSVSSQHSKSKGRRPSMGLNTPGAQHKIGKRESLSKHFRTSFTGSKTDGTRKSGSFNVERSAQSDEDFEMGPGMGSAKRRTADRRASSMVARAELSTHESNSYKDWPQNTQNPDPQRSFREPRIQYVASSSRVSYDNPRTGGRTDAVQSEASGREQPVEIKIQQETILELGPDLQDPFDPVRRDLVLTKAFDVPFSPPERGEMSALHQMNYAKEIEVFKVPLTSADLLTLFVLDRRTECLAEISMNLNQASRTSPAQQSHASSTSLNDGIWHQAIRSFTVNWTNGITDATKILDKDVCTLAILKRTLKDSFRLSLLPLTAAPFRTSQSKGQVVFSKVDCETSTVKLSKCLRPTPPGELRKRDPTRIMFPSSSLDTDVLSSLTKSGHKLMHPGPRGEFDIVDSHGHHLRYQLQLRPKNAFVKKILDVSDSVVRKFRHSTLLSTWWQVHQTFGNGKSYNEWSSLVITLFTLVVGQHKKDQVDAESSLDKMRGAHWRKVSGVLAGKSPWNWILANPGAVSGRQPRSKLILRCAEAAREHIRTTDGTNGVHSPQSLHSNVEGYPSALAELLVLLHLIREEEKLSVNSGEPCGVDQGNLAPVLAQFGYWFGWTSWTGQPGRYYSFEVPVTEVCEYETSRIGSFLIPPPPFDPPSIYKWLKRAPILTDAWDFLSSAYLSHEGVTGNTDSNVDQSPLLGLDYAKLTPRLYKIMALMKEILEPDNADRPLTKETLERHLRFQALEAFPETIMAIIRSHIARLGAKIPTTSTYASVGQISQEDNHMLEDRQYSTDIQNLDRYICARFSGLDVRNVCSSILAAPSRLDMRGPREVMKMIFREDTRSIEPARLLCPQLVPVAVLQPPPGGSEAQFLEAQQNHAKLVYTRTMAVVSGQALLEYHCQKPLPTQKLEILLFNTSCRMQPSGITVNADRSNFVEEKVSWAFFHAGVQTGLRITRDARDLDTSWLFLNKPTELGNRHAGLLLALGLNGHLKSLAKWLAFKYLTPKHDMTSIGLLLGWSASYFGSMDSLITRVLSVHLESLLPAGSAELNLSPLVQTAATMGVGLLYYNSQHRRMSEKMLLELEHVDSEIQAGTSPTFDRNEGYRLAAGFALGFINLGKGKDLRALRGLRTEERLMHLATGPCDINVVHILDQATAGATIATALIFMKTHVKDVAQKIGIPHTAKQFDTIRPDLLLLRVVARNLIMWNHILPKQEWIWDSLPEDLKVDMRPVPFSLLGHRATVLDFVATAPLCSSNLSLYNILAGLCWSIALKFAGSAEHSARDCLINYYDRVTFFLTHAPRTYDERLTRDALMRFQHLLILAAATVMAGTGDLYVLTRSRVLHSAVSESSTFGFHQASHMAMGALFIGQGRFTFGTSNLAIASLLCAFYPIFPVDVLDNRAHLQAFRHFWVFATESRCIMPRDMETMETIITPVEIFLRDGTRRTLMAPALLPDLENIARISTISDEYWEVILDFKSNPVHLASFRKHHTIFLRRKSILMQYGSQFGITIAMRTDPELNRCSKANAFDWIFDLRVLESFGIGPSEARSIFPRGRAREERDKKRLFLIEEGKDPALDSEEAPPITTLLDPRITGIDDTLTMSEDVESIHRDRVMGLSILFEWSERELESGKRLVWDEWIGEEAVAALRAAVVKRVAKEARAQTRTHDIEEGNVAGPMAID